MGIKTIHNIRMQLTIIRQDLRNMRDGLKNRALSKGYPKQELSAQ
jgi:hypothetical protein